MADNGTMTVSGSILDAGSVGTNDTDGILDVVNAWNSNTVMGVLLKGGEMRGGTLTNEAFEGISGFGLVSSKVINNGRILADQRGSTLIVQTAAHDNDWDGTTNAGQLSVNDGATLELHDNGSFQFYGTVSAVSHGTVFANGFDLDMKSGSALNLTGGTFKHSGTLSISLEGAVTVGAGLMGDPSSLVSTAAGGFSFNATNTTTLNAALQLDNPVTTVSPGAVFSGTSRLINMPGRLLAPHNTAVINVVVENRGTLSPGQSGIARNDTGSFVQTATGNLAIGINGTGVGSFDYLQVNGLVQLAGSLTVTLGGGYVPALTDTIPVIAATGVVSGTFSSVVQPAGMPAGLAFEPVYASNNVQLRVVTATQFDLWINTFGITNPADRTKSANPDSDNLNNLGEFATDGNPASGVNNGKIVGKIAMVGGEKVFTLTLPVRIGTVADPADPAGGQLGLKQSADGLFYTIQASDDLGAWTLAVAEVTGGDATAIQLGLPALNSGWIYRTFRSPGPVAGDPRELMRVMISD